MRLKILIMSALLVSFTLVSNSAKAPLAQNQLDLEKGLVAYWSFDEGEGDIVFDESENHNDGVLKCVGDSCSPPKWGEGMVGYALKFDGADDYIEIPQSKHFYVNEITVAFWVKFNTHNDNKIQNFIQKKGWGWGPGWLLRTKYKTIQAIFYNGETYTSLLEAEGPAGTWIHLAVTHSGSKAKLYINHNQVDYDAETTLKHSDKSLLLGKDNGTRYFLNGIIDEVYIYTRALSEGEIEALFKRK